MAWDDFLGQDKASTLLQAFINSGRIPTALIFSGVNGVGKFSLAKEFAKSCNCIEAKSAPCDKCVNCLGIDKETHPDLFIIRPLGKANEITIDMIRELQRFLNLSPQIADRKFFIIDSADRMNIESSNAFLKSLEEPPLDSVVILVSSNSNSLLPTIKSRCQMVKFHPLRKDVIKTILEEKLNLESIRADYLAGISQGSMAIALKFKDLDASKIVNTMSSFLRPAEFLKSKGMELYEQRGVLKEKIEYLIFFLRDILYLNADAPELVMLAKNNGISTDRSKNTKDIIAKIEKLEYLYNALDSNVSSELVYKIIRTIWQEVSVYNEVFS
ncbi:MAG: DNA polymerase III subunit delta' [Candidatus Saelkia tenebricola]|nr:DNA polymerase III subunit delta' [Candidatus Saelkia tenebricola]